MNVKNAVKTGIFCLFAVALIGQLSTPGNGQTTVSPDFHQPANGSSGGGSLAVQQGIPSQSQLVQALGRAGAANDMIGFSHSDDSGTQTITLVHTGKSWIAVYHIDRSGKIHLVSSRPIDADFSLQLNATSPLPEEIRAIGRR
jgi:hypothetical protein